MVRGYGLSVQAMVWRIIRVILSSLIKTKTSFIFNIFLRLFNPIGQGRVSGLKSSLVLLVTRLLVPKNLSFANQLDLGVA